MKLSILDTGCCKALLLACSNMNVCYETLSGRSSYAAKQSLLSTCRYMPAAKLCSNMYLRCFVSLHSLTCLDAVASMRAQATSIISASVLLSTWAYPSADQPSIRKIATKHPLCHSTLSLSFTAGRSAYGHYSLQMHVGQLASMFSG